MTVQAIDQSYLISPTPQQPSQEKKTQRFRPQVMGGKIEDPGVYEKEVEVFLRHGPDFNRSPAFLKRGSVGAGRRGEKDFTAETQRTRRRRFSSLAGRWRQRKNPRPFGPGFGVATVGKGEWHVIGLRRVERIEARVLFSCRALTGKKRKCQLCGLCASSEAGGDTDFIPETQRTRRLKLRRVRATDRAKA